LQPLPLSLRRPSSLLRSRPHLLTYPRNSERCSPSSTSRHEQSSRLTALACSSHSPRSPVTGKASRVELFEKPVHACFRSGLGLGSEAARMPMSSSISDHTGTHAHVLKLLVSKLQGHADTPVSYQLESAFCKDMPFEIGLPDIEISHRRIVLATTGMRPSTR